MAFYLEALNPSTSYKLVTNLVDERGVFQFLQLRDLQRHSSGNNANISSLISSGSYNPVGPEYSSSTSAIFLPPRSSSSLQNFGGSELEKAK
jgi:hypothetical protein